MTKEAEPPLDERIVQVLRHLGIARAHIGARMAPDWQGLATLFPQFVTVTKTEQQFATFQHQNLSTLSPEGNR
jgi:hypothetical protein